jgi:hypothetical protein
MFVVNIVIKIIYLCVFFISFPVHSLIITGSDAIEINGPESTVRAFDSSTVTVSSGADIAFLYGHDNATININGGDISWLWLYGNSEVNISFVEDLSWLLVNNNVQVNIFGSGFSYANGHLSGFWANGSAFSFWALEESDLIAASIGNIQPDNINLHVVSAPSSMYLFLVGIGFLLIRRRA